MSEDLEITFGKSVLIEKCPNDIISLGINLFCKENVHKSHLHCLVFANGWLLVIRYMQGISFLGNDYSCFRIIMIKRKEILTFSKEEQYEFLNNTVLNIHSTREKSYNLIQNGIQIIDTSIVVCHKNVLSHLLKKSLNECLKESKLKTPKDGFYDGNDFKYHTFSFAKLIPYTHKGSPPCARNNYPNNCSLLYGGNKKIQVKVITSGLKDKLREYTKNWLKIESQRIDVNKETSMVIKLIK